MESAPIGGDLPPRDVVNDHVANDQAGRVGRTAQESGRQVASTAVDGTRNVAGETLRQAKDMTREVGDQVKEQTTIQKDKAAGGLRSLGEELRSMSHGDGQTGPASELARQAADKVTDIAAWIEARDPGSLVDEVRDLARRKPGTFLLGAAAAGIVAGRLTRGAVQAAKADDETPRTPPLGSPDLPVRAEAYRAGATPIGDVAAAESEGMVADLRSTPNPRGEDAYETAGR